MEFDLGLIEKMRNGEQSAFSMCYQQLSPLIYSTVLRICHCKTSAQDILQETFIQIFKSLNTLDNDKKFIAWSKRISYHKTINWIRLHDKHLVSSNVQDIEGISDTEDLQLTIENNHYLTQLMLKVAPEARLILWLFIVDEYSHQEIADMHEKSVSFSKSIVSRSLKTLSIKGVCHE